MRVVDQPHGSITSAGLRFEADGKMVCYATDFSAMTDDMKALYKGCDLWIADALRRRPHPTHATLDDVLGWANELDAGHTALIHMDNTMDYAAVAAELPANVEPGYDGLEFVL